MCYAASKAACRFPAWPWVFTNTHCVTLAHDHLCAGCQSLCAQKCDHGCFRPARLACYATLWHAECCTLLAMPVTPPPKHTYTHTPLVLLPFTPPSLVPPLQGAFHGRTIGAMALTSSKVIYKQHFGPFMPGVHIAPYPYCLHCKVQAEKVRITSALLYCSGQHSSSGKGQPWGPA